MPKEVKEMKDLAKSLEHKEKALHEKMGPNQRRVLDGKNLYLFCELLRRSGYPDKIEAEDIAIGVDQIGIAPYSNALNRKMVPATVSESELRARSPLARRELISKCTSSGSKEQDEELYRITLEERDNGWLSGPMTEKEMDSKYQEWLPCRRLVSCKMES
jgi:hypothetical protein